MQHCICTAIYGGCICTAGYGKISQINDDREQNGNCSYSTAPYTCDYIVYRTKHDHEQTMNMPPNKIERTQNVYGAAKLCRVSAGLKCTEKGQKQALVYRMYSISLNQ